MGAISKRVADATVVLHGETMSITIEEITSQRAGELSGEDIASINRLLGQLSPGKDWALGTFEIHQVTLYGFLLAAYSYSGEERALVGMTTLLISYKLASARFALIEDVVVDKALRGHGIGEALMQSAIDHARRADASFIDLSSNPMREAANRLYLRLGFQIRESNFYRLKL